MLLLPHPRVAREVVGDPLLCAPLALPEAVGEEKREPWGGGANCPDPMRNSVFTPLGLPARASATARARAEKLQEDKLSIIDSSAGERHTMRDRVDGCRVEEAKSTGSAARQL
jgi:hypothetical protein